mmetsp:Transcript_20285/g.61796  ORF Transcript_20285/g.61796 Transcript_20285/m.61796 type:complete len:81 (-) Transcript_20285:127-369(-)
MIPSASFGFIFMLTANPRISSIFHKAKRVRHRFYELINFYARESNLEEVLSLRTVSLHDSMWHEVYGLWLTSSVNQVHSA